MQQRSSSSSSSRGSDDEHNHRAINIAAEQQQQQAKRRRNGNDDDNDMPVDGLPLYHARRREVSRSRSSPEILVHLIPLLVLLCLFILWWFSFSVDVKIKDGRITGIRQIDTPLPNDSTRIDITILAVAATPPISSIPQNLSLSGNYETDLHAASSPPN